MKQKQDLWLGLVVLLLASAIFVVQLDDLILWGAFLMLAMGLHYAR